MKKIVWALSLMFLVSMSSMAQGGGTPPGGGGGNQPGGGGQPGTGVSQIENGKLESESDAIYDLCGRRLSAVPSRGMYIRNGKKFIVR